MTPAIREIPFDCDVMVSHLGRLVRVRDDVNSDKWRHGVACFAYTEWAMEDHHGDGVMCKVEKPSGGYQLQWGLFERVEQARSQKRSRQKFSSEKEPFFFDDMLREGLLEFTDRDDEPGTLDLNKCDDAPAAWKE